MHTIATNRVSPAAILMALDCAPEATAAPPTVMVDTEDVDDGVKTTDVVCVTDKDCPVEFQCTMGMCVPRLG